MDAGISIAIVAGWLFGGLVNYLADVLPRRRKLVQPFCLQCGGGFRGIAFWLWPGRCSSCGVGRGVRTWLVFIGGLAAAAFLWLDPSLRLPFWLNILVWAYFGLVIVIDIEHRLILHVTSLVGAVLGLAVGIWLHGPVPTVLGGVAGFVFMLGMHMLGNLFVRFMARRRKQQGESGEPIEDALGFGDVTLAGVIGLMLGWPGIIAGLVLTILLGGAVSLVVLLTAILTRRYQAFAAIPYGPFLALATLFLLYFPQNIISKM